MNYYLLKINSLSNTFSIIEAGNKIAFSLDTANVSDKSAVLQQGDKIIGCVKEEYKTKAKFIFSVINNNDTAIEMEKIIEVNCGSSLNDEKGKAVEQELLVKITKDEFETIMKEVAPTVDCGEKEGEFMKSCLEIEREPRTDKIHPLNLIIYGAPGTGKTYSTAEYAQAIIQGITLKEFQENNKDRKAVMKAYNKLVKSGQVVFTTFHQSYGYEEFIQGLRPDTTSEKMSFKTVDGVFKRIADKALNDQENNYVIIIDEINRANISKVFGELITLIEDDKRWGELNQTSATLQSGDPFAVPNNLYIVGTMNSADKSISLIDAALRRRFEFVEQKPNALLVNDSNMRAVLTKLNEQLADQLDSSDLLIGHSYFMNKTIDELPTVLNNSIIPLLYEYFYDNKKKVMGVLNSAIEPQVDFVVEDDKLGRIFIERVSKNS